jgi:hypothetical protein
MYLEVLELLPINSTTAFILSYGAAGLTSISLILYAYQVYHAHLKTSIATWGMFLVIDFAGLILAIATGSNNPIIHIAWVCTDILICLAALKNRANMRWTYIETISVVVCIGSLTAWLTTQASWSLIGYLVACAFTMLPQAHQYWTNKLTARKSAWIWVVNSIALVMTILSVQPLTPEYTVLSLGLLLLNLAMVLIALR